jgi:uncharacterized protein (TIGR04255 family)
MAAAVVMDPFGEDPVEVVSLPRSPMVRMLAQVRFPQLAAMSVGSVDATVGRLVDHLKGEYPILGEKHEAQVVLTTEGATQTPGAKLWELRSHDDNWRVTMGAAFVALDTKVDASPGDFARPLEAILCAMADVLDPPYAERLGVRCTYRVDDQDLLLRLHELVRPELLGGLAVPRLGDTVLAHTLSESLFATDSRMLHARWGLLPPNALIDPTLPTATSMNWILDLDSFVQERMDFDPPTLASTAEQLARAAYNFFRWAVTEDFLREFGGEL